MKKQLLFSFLMCFVAISGLMAQTNFKLKPTTYVGALSDDPAQDWTKNWTNFDPQNTNYPAASDLSTLDGMDSSLPVPGVKNVTGTWTLNNTSVYRLRGLIVVRSGSKLVIPAGTVIRAEADVNASPKNYATIVVERGGQIEINGTESQPVVFTSNKAAGARSRGDWGGLVVCGKSQHNAWAQATDAVQYEGFDNVAFDNTLAKFGGTDLNDNSGSNTYVRFEYGGLAFELNKEVNGITFGAVGAATVVNHIQVSYSNDDSFEWFGGTVNGSHYIALAGTDDDFDTDNGYAGINQFGIGVRDSSLFDLTWNATSGASTSEGFESDNNAGGSGASPATNAIFSNFTMVGPIPYGKTYAQMSSTARGAFRRGARIRRNSSLRIVNSTFTGYRNFLMIDGDSCVRKTNWPSAVALLNPATGVDPITRQIYFTNNLICNTADAFVSTTDTTANGLIEVNRATGSNGRLLALNGWMRQNTVTQLANRIDPAPCGTSALLINPSPYSTTPDFRPSAGSPLLTGANFFDNPVLAPVTLNCAVAATTNSTNASCPNGTDGTATVTVNGATGAITYAWSNNATTATVSNLAPGTYTVVISDANACSATANVTITGTDSVVPAITCPANVAVCAGLPTGTANLTATATDNCSGAVTTAKGAGWNANDTYPVGVTALTFIATDASGNTANCSFNLTINARPTATATATSTTCGASNGTATATATGGTGAITYTWSNNATGAALTNLAAGTYTVVATDANGCSNTASANVASGVDNVAPVITCPANRAVCLGLPTGLAAVVPTGTDNCNGTITYTKTTGWNNNDVYPVGATVLGYTATDANGNSSTCTFTLTVNPLPTATVDQKTDQAIGLMNGAISITIVNGPATVQWKKDGVNFSTNEDLTGLVAGVYTATITNTATGCVGTSAPITILAIVSTQEVSAADAALTVQPNPVTDQLVILSDLEQVTAVRVADESGRIVLALKGNINQVDFNGLPAGLYLMQIQLADGTLARRKVIKH